MVRYPAVEWPPRGIPGNGINPGYIETDSSRLYAGPDYDRRVKAEWIAETPLGRVGHLDEVAGVIAVLRGADAGFILGQTIVVDGGRTPR